MASRGRWFFHDYFLNGAKSRNRERHSAFIAAEGIYFKEALMKSIMKAAAGIVLAGGIAMGVSAPANAAVYVGLGLPAPVAYPAPYYVPPPCYAYGPYACPRPAYFAPRPHPYWWGPRWYRWHPVRHYRHW